MPLETYTLKTPLSNVSATFQHNTLINITFTNKHSLQNTHSILQTELNAYFKNPRHIFNIHFALHGTDFQKKVWHALQRIPVGETLTYGSLAKQLNTSARAIGQACRTNPILIIIPCHRIVSATGIGGFAGDMTGAQIEKKRFLLAHELGVRPRRSGV